MSRKKPYPIPLFDTADNLVRLNDQIHFCANNFNVEDFQHARRFLLCYRARLGTFNSYRREIEKLLQWCFLISKKSLPELTHEDIIRWVKFSQKPPTYWIGTRKVPRFVETSDKGRIPNPNWRPFVATVSKLAYSRGKRADVKNFTLSPASLKESLSILSTFFHYLLQEGYVTRNPVLQIRQKSQFIRKQQTKQRIRRLTPLQWRYVIESAEQATLADPKQHARGLFIISALYAMYLRISELVASERWVPTMNDFYCDDDNQWWFITVGKGNKQRQIAVSNAMLLALRRWRLHLNLSPLPSPADQSFLLPKLKGYGPITSTTYVREIVQSYFDHAVRRLQVDGLIDAAENLREATVHWLRHTGISDDIQHRPREHVRDDAGHTSSVTTDQYIDVMHKERHHSARDKPMFDSES